MVVVQIGLGGIQLWLQLALHLCISNQMRREHTQSSRKLEIRKGHAIRGMCAVN